MSPYDFLPRQFPRRELGALIRMFFGSSVFGLSMSFCLFAVWPTPFWLATRYCLSRKSIHGCQCTLNCYALAWLAVDSSRTRSGRLDAIPRAERLRHFSLQGPSRPLRRAKECGLEDRATARTFLASLHRRPYLCHRVRAQDLAHDLPRP